MHSSEREEEEEEEEEDEDEGEDMIGKREREIEKKAQNTMNEKGMILLFMF